MATLLAKLDIPSRLNRVERTDRVTDDVSDIQDMYNNAMDSEHEKLERHRLEHDLTWRYFERDLPPSGSILEIGAATGRYTLALAQRRGGDFSR